MCYKEDKGAVRVDEITHKEISADLVSSTFHLCNVTVFSEIIEVN